MSERSGTFLVTEADPDSAILRDVETAQLHTLSANPGVETGDVLEATLQPEPPMEVTWEAIEVDERRTVDVVDSDLAPTTREREVAAGTEVGDVARIERAGTGEIHVLPVPPGEVEAAAEDVLADTETVARAARLEAVRVEVRRSADEGEGVVSVRYLPD